MPQNTRKRTPNSNTFIFDQNNAQKKNAMKSINDLKEDIINLRDKQEEYDKLLYSLRKKHGISTSNPNHGLDLTVLLKTKSAQKNKKNCVSRIRKKEERILSLKKSLSSSNDLKGGKSRRLRRKLK